MMDSSILLSLPPRKTPAFKHGDIRGVPSMGLEHRGTNCMTKYSLFVLYYEHLFIDICDMNICIFKKGEPKYDEGV
jgi:hypothetical protein